MCPILGSQLYAYIYWALKLMHGVSERWIRTFAFCPNLSSKSSWSIPAVVTIAPSPTWVSYRCKQVIHRRTPLTENSFNTEV